MQWGSRTNLLPFRNTLPTPSPPSFFPDRRTRIMHTPLRFRLFFFITTNFFLFSLGVSGSGNTKDFSSLPGGVRLVRAFPQIAASTFPCMRRPLPPLLIRTRRLYLLPCVTLLRLYYIDTSGCVPLRNESRSSFPSERRLSSPLQKKHFPMIGNASSAARTMVYLSVPGREIVPPRPSIDSSILSLS